MDGALCQHTIGQEQDIYGTTIQISGWFHSFKSVKDTDYHARFHSIYSLYHDLHKP